MGKRLVAVGVVCAACISKPPPTEPFRTVELAADSGSMQRAFAALLRFGMEPAIDAGAGAAYGPSAPIVTPWTNDAGYRRRWVVYTERDEVVIMSVCFTEALERKGSTATKTVVCPEQPVGVNAFAKKLGAAIGEWRKEESSTFVPKEAPKPPSYFCTSAGMDSACFSTAEECGRARVALAEKGIRGTTCSPADTVFCFNARRTSSGSVFTTCAPTPEVCRMTREAWVLDAAVDITDCTQR